MTSNETQPPRYATLRDYTRVVRANRWLIAAVTLVFAAAALGASLLQEKRYTASAQLSFRDIQQDLIILGANATPEQNADIRAAANAELITRPEVSRIARRQLDTDLPAAALAGMVDARVGVRTFLVSVDATADDPDFAARVANAFAAAAKQVGDREQRQRLDVAIASLRRQAGPTPDTFREQVAQEQLTALQTLRSIVEPVRIVATARPPDQPSSPRPRRNTLLGLLVGLVAGLLLAFGRDSLDRRLRRPNDVFEELELPILGRVSQDTLGASAVGGNGRATIDDDQLEAFRVVRTNLGFLSREQSPRTVLVTSGLPEEGKSTVALALAMTSALAGRRTLLVECDLRRPSLFKRLGIERSPGMTDYLTGEAAPQEVLQTVELTAPRPNGADGGAEGRESTSGTLVCISAGSVARQPAELLGSERFRDFLEKVSKAYELVVVDSSPLLPVVDALELVPHVDAVIVCVRLSQTTRSEARAAKNALEHLPQRPTGVVVTGLRRGDEEYGYYYGAYGE